MAESLASLFASKARTIKHYVINDTNQLKPDKIAQIVRSQDEVIVPNTFGTIVRDYSNFDFVQRAIESAKDYNVEKTYQRVNQKHQIIFGSLCNLVQYFAEVGGFDALLRVLQMGTAPDA